MNSIIVTGGAGFIGSHLCEYLLKQQFRVICVDNLSTSTEKNLEVAKTNPNFIFLRHDITQPLPKINSKISAIFHLASPASPNLNSPISYHALALETMLANTQGTLNLLQFAHKHQAKFIFASSSEVYGDPLVNPQPETYLGNTSTTGPRSVYDEAKRFGETLVAYFVRKHSVDGRIARIFNTYGPRILAIDGRMLTNFILQAQNNKPITVYGQGTQTRSLCYIDDLVIGLYQLLITPNLKGEIINLGATKEYPVIKYAQMVKKLLHSTSPIVVDNQLPQDDPLKRQPDISKAKKLLNWEPKINLEKGIAQTCLFYQHE